MKTFYILIPALAFLFSCEFTGVHHRGNNDRTTRTEALNDFDEIRIEGGYEIELVKGNTQSVTIEADENLMEYITTDTQGRTLVIGNIESIYSPEGIKLTIVYQNLEEIDVEGACTLTAKEAISSDDLTIKMDGAGAVDILVNVRELMVDISGAGAVKLEGEADFLEVNMSGAGGLSAFDLYAQRGVIDISGLGSADINIEKSLTASISGMGGITYRGNPEIQSKNISGLGSISRAD